MGDIPSKHSSNDDPHQKLQEKFQRKTERILGPSITEILRKSEDQRAAHERQVTEKANTPEQGQNMLSKLTEGFVEGIKNDGFLQETVGSMDIDTKTKSKIAEAMLPSKFLDLVEKHIQDMTKHPDIQRNPKNLSPEQKEVITLYLKAAYYHGKGKRYQTSFKQFASHDPAKLIAGLKNVTNQFRKNADIQGLLGVTRSKETGSVTKIDLSKFEPHVADLSKLDLSNIKFWQFDATDVDTSNYKYKLAEKGTRERAGIEAFLTRAEGTLLTGYSNEAYIKEPDLYRNVLEKYIKIKTYESKQKSNFNAKNLDNLVEIYEDKRSDLFDWNERQKYNREEKARKEREERLSILNEEKFQEMHKHDINLTLGTRKTLNASRVKNSDSFQKDLLSNDQDKRTLANEMALTRAYYELWQNQYQKDSKGNIRLAREALKQPESDEFMTNYTLAKEILTANSEQMHTYSPDAIRDINTKLQDFANNLATDMPNKSDKDSTKANIKEQDLNTLQLALRDAIATARTLDHWATNWENDYKNKLKFDLNEPWVQESMQQLGIQQNHITESYQKLLNNLNAKAVISNVSGNPANKVAYEYPADNIVSTYKSLVEASAHLKYIHSQLHKGFPVKSDPEVINGLKRVYNDGKDMNCLLLSFLQLSTNWNENTIKREVKNIRGIVIENMLGRLSELTSSIPQPVEQRIEKLAQDKTLAQDKDKTEEFNTLNKEWSLLISERNTLREHITNMNTGSMLQLGGFEGQHIIKCLAEDIKVEGRPLIDRKRGLLIYRYDKGRINCVESELMPRSLGATDPPYTLFLQQDAHFEAMKQP